MEGGDTTTRLLRARSRSSVEALLSARLEFIRGQALAYLVSESTERCPEKEKSLDWRDLALHQASAAMSDHHDFNRRK